MFWSYDGDEFRETYPDILEDAGTQILMLQSRNRYVGFAHIFGQHYEEDVANRILGIQDPFPLLADFCIDKDYQGQKLGPAFLSELEGFLTQNGYEWLVLEAEEHNTPALRLYRNMGYTEHPGLSEGGDKNYHVFSKALP